MMTMKMILLPVSILGWFLVRAQAQCSEAEIDSCALDGRDCVTSPVCGPCLSGLVEFPSRGCLNISELTLADFIAEFQPTYVDSEDSQGVAAARLLRLKAAAEFISDFYLSNSTSDFEVGLTAFSADGEDEYQQRSGFSANISNPDYAIPGLDESDGDASTLAEKVDWRSFGAVTSVKDQGRCGCCWAVSMVGAIEGAAAIHAKEQGEKYLQNLSWQQLISCNEGNLGCGGGSLLNALGYSWLNEFGGLTRDNEYPYTDYEGTTTDTCSVESKPLAVTISEPKLVLDFTPSVDFDSRILTMKQALTVAPVSSTLKSSCQTMSNYKKGIMTDDGDCACSSSACIDHAVLMVGYDDTSSPPCWILKNSWGTAWGEDGYFRISQAEKGDYGLFGVLSHGVHAQLAQNVTSQVKDDYEEPVDVWVWVLVGLASLAGLVCILGIVRHMRSRGGGASPDNVEQEM
jgi:Papain family cysteine protease